MANQRKNEALPVLDELLRLFKAASGTRRFLIRSAAIIKKASGPKDRELLSQTRRYLIDLLKTKEELQSLKEKSVKTAIDTDREDTLVEKKLLESYKHLGAINRKISILYNMHSPSGARNSCEAFSYILSSAINISRAKIVNIYRFDRQNESLLLIKTDKNNKCCLKKSVPIGKYPLIKEMIANKSRIQAIIKNERQTPFADNIKKVLLLPILSGKKLLGIILFGFSAQTSITSQELDLMEAFGNQASLILRGLDIFKNKKASCCPEALKAPQLRLFKK